MAAGSRGTGLVAALAVAFAAHVVLLVTLSGRFPGPAVALAAAVGALVASALAAGRPLAAVRSLDARSALSAAAGGLLLVFASPAAVGAVRMSDAPAGSVVVFWLACAWAALAALTGALARVRAREWRVVLAAVAGAAAALAGGAGVLADWERPSSFSPLVKFPVEEALIAAAGLAAVAGLVMLARTRADRRSGALIAASFAATVAAAVWSAVDAANVTAALAQSPAPFLLLGAAWGATVVLLTAVWAGPGPLAAASAAGVAPVIISGLALGERAVGVSGPQPMVLPGVVAGALLAAAGSATLLGVDGRGRALHAPRWVALAAWVPAALALVGLALPALAVVVTREATGGAATLTWRMPGAESVAALAALALALLLPAAVFSRRPALAAALALAACAAWPALLDVPTHVWVRGLSPAIQQDYGTEYASITFTHLHGWVAYGSVALTALGLVAVLVSRAPALRRALAGEKAGTWRSED